MHENTYIDLTREGAGALFRQFVGFLSADIPEIRGLEVPKLGEAVERFIAARTTCEDEARAIMERAGVDNVGNYTSGDLVEFANILHAKTAQYKHLRDVYAALGVQWGADPFPTIAALTRMHNSPTALMVDLLDTAWRIIAIANGGDWDRARPEWKEAASAWCDRYFSLSWRLDHAAAPSTEAPPSADATGSGT